VGVCLSAMLDKNDFNLEENVAERLNHLLQDAEIPTLPVVAQKLLDLCQDENANFAQFARVIEADPGTASRLLRVANSAYYGLRNKVTNLERAITYLGLKYVQSISLGFQITSVMSKFESVGFDMQKFWQESILRGVMARQIARRYCPERSEDAFLVGLLQDCGVPILAQALGEEYVKLRSDPYLSQASLYHLERSLFEIDHVTAAKAIMSHWALPDLLARPICNHHSSVGSKPNKIERIQLCQISYFVGTLSLNEPATLDFDDLTLPEYAQNTFGLDIEDLTKILQQVREEFAGISQLFADILPDDVNVTVLLERANRLLCNLACETYSKNFNFETELEKYKTKCDDLTQTMEDYRRQACTEALTGLDTRQMMKEFLATAYDDLRMGRTSLTLLFADIDNFKEINDRYGHLGGDRLLLDFAQMLQGIFGDMGCVARYGGDEFVVALPGLEQEEAIRKGESLLERTRRFSIPTDPTVKKGGCTFSCSIGMVYYEAGAAPAGAAEIMEKADQQMYKAKNSGKNDLSIEIISGPTEQCAGERDN